MCDKVVSSQLLRKKYTNNKKIMYYDVEKEEEKKIGCNSMKLQNCVHIYDLTESFMFFTVQKMLKPHKIQT